MTHKFDAENGVSVATDEAQRQFLKQPHSSATGWVHIRWRSDLFGSSARDGGSNEGCILVVFAKGFEKPVAAEDLFLALVLMICHLDCARLLLCACGLDVQPAPARQ